MSHYFNPLNALVTFKNMPHTTVLTTTTPLTKNPHYLFSQEVYPQFLRLIAVKRMIGVYFLTQNRILLS